jgi:hypothetical protein
VHLDRILCFLYACARFQADPKEVYLRAVKRILRYLFYTPKFGLWYPRGSTFDLIGYSDADWAGCKINRKSTSGTCQFLGRSLVSWASKKQNSVALSTAEAECQRLDPGGSLDRRVKLSLRVPAQMGWREMEHKGGNVARVILRQGGCARSRGYKRSRGRESEPARQPVLPRDPLA